MHPDDEFMVRHVESYILVCGTAGPTVQKNESSSDLALSMLSLSSHCDSALALIILSLSFRCDSRLMLSLSSHCDYCQMATRTGPPYSFYSSSVGSGKLKDSYPRHSFLSLSFSLSLSLPLPLSLSLSLALSRLLSFSLSL